MTKKKKKSTEPRHQRRPLASKAIRKPCTVTATEVRELGGSVLRQTRRPTTPLKPKIEEEALTFLY